MDNSWETAAQQWWDLCWDVQCLLWLSSLNLCLLSAAKPPVAERWLSGVPEAAYFVIYVKSVLPKNSL